MRRARHLLLLWPEDGIMRKGDVRRVYDGSIFRHKADEYAEKQAEKAKGATKQQAEKDSEHSRQDSGGWEGNWISSRLARGVRNG